MSKRTAYAACLVFSLALSGGAHAQAPKPSQLTALDYIEIQQLIAKYARPSTQ